MFAAWGVDAGFTQQLRIVMTVLVKTGLCRVSDEESFTVYSLPSSLSQSTCAPGDVNAQLQNVLRRKIVLWHSVATGIL